ncbi:MAG: hypothetical protein ACK4VV_14090, partial [Pseudomonas sp.]
MTTLSHSHSPDETMNQLLDAWVRAVLRYDSFWSGDDCCWWYNERTNVSVLAGAAWAEGWVALEEYSTQKGAPTLPDQEKIDFGGRVDLYISNRDVDFAFEAKLAWQPIAAGDEGGNYSKVKTKRDQADDAAKQLYKEAGTHYAATFVVPFFKPSEIQSEIENRRSKLTEWIEMVKSEVGADESLAYVFPRLGQNYYINDKGYAYPGVVLILKQIPA